MSYKDRVTKISLFVFTSMTANVICGLGGARADARPCATVPYQLNSGLKPGTTTPNPITNSPQVWSFVSEPNLHPMKVTVNLYESGTSSGLIFLAPYAFSDDATFGQSGSLILDNTGNPFWFRPLSSPNLMNTDFRLQHLNGNPVLTFWQGTLATPPAYTNIPAGSSEPGSCYYILDQTYRVIRTVTAQFGFTSDIHELLLTPANTALFLSTRAVPMNLVPYGGPSKGYVQDFAIQEIDLQTNAIVFFWDALTHIPLVNSFEPASSASSSGNIWDAFHLNSIGLTNSASDILVSGRNTSTIYRINKPTGKIVWQLGGKQSSFTIEKAAEFSWQHDARFLPNNVVSMFDDNCCENNAAPTPPGTPPSHGLFLQLDLTNMTASLQREYYHDPNLNIGSQGNTQSLASGNVFVGWGQSAYYGEFAPGGNSVDDPALNTLYDAQMPGSNYTYRAYREDWVGTPYYPPSIAVQSRTGQTTVYASWNGATEIKSWELLGGSDASNLVPITNMAKSGFETAISVTTTGPFFQVQALNANGQILGVSRVVRAW
jgi:Arylsulfotransferase (ASST)